MSALQMMFHSTLCGSAGYIPSIMSIPSASIQETSLSIEISAAITVVAPVSVKIETAPIATPTVWTPQPATYSATNIYVVTGLTVSTGYLVRVSYIDADGTINGPSLARDTATLIALPTGVTSVKLTNIWRGDDATRDNVDLDIYGATFTAPTVTMGPPVYAEKIYYGTPTKPSGISISADDKGSDLTVTHTQHSESMTVTFASLDAKTCAIVMSTTVGLDTSTKNLKEVKDLTVQVLSGGGTITNITVGLSLAAVSSHAILALYKTGGKWYMKLLDDPMTTENLNNPIHMTTYVTGLIAEIAVLTPGDYLEAEGGYYAGIINDAGTQYKIIVSPKIGGEVTAIKFKTTPDVGPTECLTLTNGLAATNAMIAANTPTVIYPAADFVNTVNTGTGINGHNDWYIPARDELEICYREFKPDATLNLLTNNPRTSIGYPGTGGNYGVNENSIPDGEAYTTSLPLKTEFTKFTSTGSEKFIAGWYWTSTENTAAGAWWHNFDNGVQGTNPKTQTYGLRLVRRVLVV